MIASMTTSISSTNIQDMEVRGREIVQALFGHILNSNVRALELFVSGDTDGSGELDFHEFGSALNMMNVTIHPADLELAFYTLDEEDEGTLLIADIMDQYRAQAKVWKANRMKGGIGKWPNRNKMLESEDWEAAGKKDWEAAAARASVAKLGQANLYDIDSDDEEDAERLTAGHINRQVYFQEVRQAEEAEAMAVQEAEQAAQAQESFDKEEAEAVVAEQAAAKEEAEAQAAVAIANIEEAEARAALEEARAEEAAALAAEKVAIATREKHAEAVSDAEREKKEADEAREAVEEAKAKLNSAVRNTKDSDGAGFWVEIDDATSGMQAQLARELEEAEARLDKEQREADEATVVATQRLEQEEAAAEVARSARAVAEVAKLKAADEQAEAEAAKLVAERELSDFYHARDTATKERAEAEKAKCKAELEKAEAEAAARRAKRERLQAEEAKKAWELKKQIDAEQLFLKKRGVSSAKKAGLVAVATARPHIFKANDRRSRMVVLKPAVDVNSYRAKREAMAAKAVALKKDLGSLEHSFLRLPAITPRTPRVVNTARHVSVDGKKAAPKSIRSPKGKGPFTARVPELPGIARQSRQLAELRKMAGPGPRPPKKGARRRSGGRLMAGRSLREPEPEIEERRHDLQHQIRTARAV